MRCDASTNNEGTQHDRAPHSQYHVQYVRIGAATNSKFSSHKLTTVRVVGSCLQTGSCQLSSTLFPSMLENWIESNTIHYNTVPYNTIQYHPWGNARLDWWCKHPTNFRFLWFWGSVKIQESIHPSSSLSLSLKYEVTTRTCIFLLDGIVQYVLYRSPAFG